MRKSTFISDCDIERLLMVHLSCLNTILIILLKRAHRNFVQSNRRLIRILDQDEFTLLGLRLHHHVYEGTHDGPSVVEVQVHLAGELAWLIPKHTKDDMIGGGLGV
jgi:hypothetical protein